MWSEHPVETAPDIHHDAAACRVETRLGDELAEVTYRLESGRMIIDHTLVPPAFRGRGIAEQLVRAALGIARERGLLVVPRCSYVAAFLERHAAEFADLR